MVFLLAKEHLREAIFLVRFGRLALTGVSRKLPSVFGSGSRHPLLGRTPFVFERPSCVGRSLGREPPSGTEPSCVGSGPDSLAGVLPGNLSSVRGESSCVGSSEDDLFPSVGRIFNSR